MINLEANCTQEELDASLKNDYIKINGEVFIKRSKAEELIAEFARQQLKKHGIDTTNNKKTEDS